MAKIRKQEIKTNKVHRLPAPLSQGIKAGNLIFVSVGPTDLRGKTIKDDFEKAVRQTLKNVKVVLEAGGSSMKEIVRVDVYIQDLENVEKFNRIYKQYVPKPYPVRSICQPARTPLDLPLGMVVTAITD